MNTTKRNRLIYSIYWMICSFTDKTGRVALAFFLLWATISVYWIHILNPTVNARNAEYQMLRKKLAEPLPILTVSDMADEKKLDVRQYQELKAFFDILKRHQLKVHQGKYEFVKEDSERKISVELEIPMEGTYRNFIVAMNESLRTLSLHINSVVLSRSTLQTNNLTILAKFTLTGEEI